MASLPLPRGPVSEVLVQSLAGNFVERLPAWPDGGPGDGSSDASDLADEALSLWVLHELSYRGFTDVDERWEWHPDLLALRWRLEGGLEQRLRKRFPTIERTTDFVADLAGLIAADDGPSLARHLQRHGSREQALELLRQRSIYHLKEADPTAWVVPRLPGGRAKAALVEVQFDEYGTGDPQRLHHDLFARGIVACGLSAEPGQYADEAITEVLEQNNAGSMFGMHRRLRGAALGHFAAFEATSSVPSRQLAQGLARLELPQEIQAYYEEHVEADAVHEQVALRDICGGLVAREPDLAEDVLFGAWTCLDLEARTATALLDRWEVA
ncbi:iron-containing redox enzyme family protein [Nocardioides sp.]|uniref:iron-containing redox enzyme family protein n=1 Tax=Nocardioides sp. TaxID=35761 RepID=UPI002CDF0460|nr:iron-containing redox enzyme family protein [Nocardioides sp.]HXH77405.1 iron-containing redox enzyme family protein [Nocardioides sp.]